MVAANTDAEAETGCSGRLKALSDPTRLAVMRWLLDRPGHVGEINEDLQIDQSLLSHHLKVLREHGLVTAERDGKAVLYRLAVKARGPKAKQVLDLGCCRLSFDD